MVELVRALRRSFLLNRERESERSVEETVGAACCTVGGRILG